MNFFLAINLKETSIKRSYVTWREINKRRLRYVTYWRNSMIDPLVNKLNASHQISYPRGQRF